MGHSHPFYEGYYCDNNSHVFTIHGRQLKTTNRQNYLYVKLTKDYVSKRYPVHKFIYECHHGLVAPNMYVYHIDNNTLNNDINNLKCTTKPNQIKAVAETTYGPIIRLYESKYHACDNLLINPHEIKNICDKKYGKKSARSKKDGRVYAFDWVE